MRKKLLIYGSFFVVLLAVFYFFIFKDSDFSQSLLPVINNNVESFSFTDQNGKKFTDRDVEGKVYVAEYFFTTCQGICPKMNANMRRVYDEFKGDSSFLIVSHTCMPEVDSVPLLKKYEARMLEGTLVKKEDGSYKISYDSTQHTTLNNHNWFFVTGDKAPLYAMARTSYLIDNNKPAIAEPINDQFIHTQLFALVDKQRRVRGIYDGLKEDEIQKLFTDIKGLLKEKQGSKDFFNKF